MINLFFSDTAAGSGAHHRKKFGIDIDTIHTLDLKLHAGDISEPFDVSKRRYVYNSYFELDFIPSNNIRDLKKAVKHDNQICMWYTMTDADEYLGMLAALDHFYGRSISFYVCDCTKICQSVALLQDKEQFDPVEMKALTNDEIKSLLGEWKAIQAENSALRLIRDGKIISLPENYIDDRIFSIIASKDTKVSEICSTILSQEDMSMKLAFIMVRLKQLIETGRIQIVSEAFTPINAHYGKPMKDFMKYTVRKKV